MTPTLSKAESGPVEGTSLWRDAWKRLRRNRMAVAGGILFAAIGLAALVGPMAGVPVQRLRL